MCAALAFALCATQAHAASGSFQQSLPVDGDIVLDVSTNSGNITITTGESNRVEIKGVIKVKSGFLGGIFRKHKIDPQELISRFESEPPVTLSDGQLQVGHIKDESFNRYTTIHYEIAAPVDTEIKSHSGSGTLSISGVTGPVVARTGSGSVKLTDVGGKVSAQSGSGSIVAKGVSGAFEAHTGSGSIRLTQIAPGDVVVSSGSGSCELHGVVGALDAHAGSGRITVDGQQNGDWRLDTGSGSVKVTLPADAAFALDAEAGSGSITVDHPVTMQGEMSKRHVKGDVRGGGNLLKIETGSGSISVK